MKSTHRLAAIALGLIAISCAMLVSLKGMQKLGSPGVIVTNLPSGKREVHLPVSVLNYASAPQPIDKKELQMLPEDTLFGRRLYGLPGQTNEPQILLDVVLMERDRSSIHRPEFCIKGMGCRIVHSEPDILTLKSGQVIPLQKAIIEQERGGARAVFIYWFVADRQMTASHEDRMWSMAKSLVTTGQLQRWAFIRCYKPCLPGQEAATYAEIQAFLKEAIPHFVVLP